MTYFKQNDVARENLISQSDQNHVLKKLAYGRSFTLVRLTDQDLFFFNVMSCSNVLEYVIYLQRICFIRVKATEVSTSQERNYNSVDSYEIVEVHI